jgi:hypothetical protein
MPNKHSSLLPVSIDSWEMIDCGPNPLASSSLSAATDATIHHIGSIMQAPDSRMPQALGLLTVRR